MSRRTTRARLLGTFFIFLSFFTSYPDKEKKRLCETAPCCAESLLPSSHSPQRREGVAICLLVGPRRVWCHFLGKRRGRRKKKKKMGAFLLPHPWADDDDDDDDASPPHPSLPPPLTFFPPPLEERAHTQGKPVYCFWLPLLIFFVLFFVVACICCPSLYLTCWSVVTVCFSCFCA